MRRWIVRDKTKCLSASAYFAWCQYRYLGSFEVVLADDATAGVQVFDREWFSLTVLVMVDVRFREVCYRIPSDGVVLT